MKDDAELLRRYARDGDESAFAELVRRYVDLVFSVALRLLNDCHLAQDITQMVFAKLAAKAAVLPESVVLAGWLHEDSRLTALQMLRTEKRRLARERIEMLNESPEDDWEKARPLIDEAIAGLDAPERDAVLLRFFGNKSFSEVGAVLRIAPDTARMRVNRALDKLREALAKRGLTTTAAALTAALIANLVTAAPQELTDSIVRSRSGLKSQFGPRKPMLSLPSAALLVITCGLLIIGGFVPKLFVRPSQSDQAGGSATPKTFSAIKNEVSTKRESLPGGKRLRLTIVEEDNHRPMSGVQVQMVTALSEDGSPFRTDLFTNDHNGEIDLPLPGPGAGDFAFSFYLTKDGYVRRVLGWAKKLGDEIDEMPSEYKTALPRAISIGGQVRGTDGNGIAGVQMTIHDSAQHAASLAREQDAASHIERTDAAGEWSCTHLRPSFQAMTYRLEHPEFVTAEYAVSSEAYRWAEGMRVLPEADYLGHKAEMRMAPGCEVRGKVSEKNGNQIGSARVTLDQKGVLKFRTAKTGPTGEFAFRNAAPGLLKLRVEAEGFAPAVSEANASSNITVVGFELEPSLGVRGRIVDEFGDAMENMIVAPERDEISSRQYYWSARTDRDGAFSWNSSPNKPFRVSILSPRVESTHVLLQPGLPLQTIVVSAVGNPRSVLVKGTVVDGTTMHPIDNASVYVNESTITYQSLSWTKGGEATNGLFAVKLSATNASYQLAIRCEGYEEARSQIFNLKEHLEPFHFAMQKSSGFYGVVLSPGGSPLQGVDVALCTREHGVLLGKRRFVYPEQSLIVRTDSKGKFRHGVAFGSHHLYAVHDQGYAEVRTKDWVNGGELRLESWASLEGTLALEGIPAPNEEISLSALLWNWPDNLLRVHGFTATTDAKGRFLFQDLPPIELRVYWMRSLGSGKRSSHPVAVTLAPGQTSQLDYNLTGNTVKGRLVWQGPGKINWIAQGRVGLMKNYPRPLLAQPDYIKASVEQKREMESEFRYSDAGRAELRQQGSIVAIVGADGIFTAPFVQPGPYRIFVGIAAPPPQLDPGDEIGFAMKEVSIPPSTTTFDIGEISVNQITNMVKTIIVK